MERIDSDPTRPGETLAEEIDAVYLWVDGSDRSFQKSLYSFLPLAQSSTSSDSLSPNRFGDNGELRYSLRSLERFAPWIRRIYLVTNGQIPDWLDRFHPQVTVVPHETLFLNKNHLPTFNTSAIEMQLHRVPNLSRRFLYLNDDVFLGAPTTPDTFLHPDGTPRLFLQETSLHDRTDSGPVHDRSYAYTQAVVDKTWGRHRPRLLPAHVPQPFDREIIAEIAQTIPREFEKTSSHRFRSAEDLVLRILYFCRELERGAGGRETAKVLQETSEDYCFAMLGRSVSYNTQ
jgi:hypothetical protein